MATTEVRRDGAKTYLLFFCDPCDTHHMIRVGEPGSWQWDGNLDAPTISPSILVNQGSANPTVPVCHSFVRGGHIEYLSDCTHALAGRTVPLSELP